MSTYTPNLDLLKKSPVTDLSQAFNIGTMMNDNWDKIDSFVALVAASIAPIYSTSSAYSVGDYCTHGGTLFRCTTAIGAGGEPWNQNHWTAISAAQLVQDVAGTTTPVMDGTGAAGSSSKWARADHVHPTDTSRAASSHNHAASAITSGTLGVARGGTGKSSVTANRFLVGNGTSALAEKTAAQVVSLLGTVTIESGTYVGTGVFGTSNTPNSLTFSGNPRFVMVVPDALNKACGFFLPDSLTETLGDGAWYQLDEPSSGATSQAYRGKLEGKTLSWTGYSAYYQLNTQGTTYHYIALCT